MIAYPIGYPTRDPSRGASRGRIPRPGPSRPHNYLWIRSHSSATCSARGE